MHTLNILLGEQSKIVAEKAKQSSPFDFIQTCRIQGRTIHYLKDLTVAQSFCDFFACPFFNSGSIPCLFDKNRMIAKERVNTILTPNLPDRTFFLGALNPHFKRIFSNTSTLNWAHFYANELIDSWKETIPLDGSEKEIEVNVQLGLSQILCRWGIKGFWGFSQNIDELHETALAILNSNFETKLPDVVLMHHQIKIKNIFHANIDHQRSMDDPLVSELSEPEDKKCTAMIANYDANLSILHQTGTYIFINLFTKINGHKSSNAGGIPYYCYPSRKNFWPRKLGCLH